MSAQLPPEHICYVHCNFCNTILAVKIMLNCPFRRLGYRLMLRCMMIAYASQLYASIAKPQVLLISAMQVSVPGNSLFGNVAVRCGHCCNLLSVNMGDLLQKLPLQDLQVWNSCFLNIFHLLLTYECWVVKQ
ncbi:hypothetical protein B296_00046417 [Ensete ventricosum]|uniref:YABBY N-terminal domain-containing protein n=1 Tax=Ensete ventricosum TaxID=4639 RepID=A0A426WZY9_ENSVE|nr:hypothetical protein B296_00046417 [Ensete ventricosum]